ncbi:hypothetical protein X777_08339 [Ooceraea biroi]|uniref:Uncharacterized protein n=1 Tax=Ooceraea biroi TaxID=2015173 RepID=A0A026WYP4_OOCBI|nr:hypothetical protein X777_08339 [Ooceraea biroi]
MKPEPICTQSDGRQIGGGLPRNVESSCIGQGSCDKGESGRQTERKAERVVH